MLHLLREQALTDMSQEVSDSLPLDAISAAQRKLDDLAVMFYTYTGVIQRDAPPAARVPDEVDELPADEAARADLASKIPEYANDIVRASADMSAAIDRIAKELELDDEKMRASLSCADDDSVQAGLELKKAAEHAESLLGRVRGAMSETEREVDSVLSC